MNSNSLEINNSLHKYLSEIYKIPILTEEEELKYSKLKTLGDINAAKILINSHLRLVVKIAMKYKSYGLSIMDLISEGNIGLMKAVKEFDLSKNCKLATYAMWWIKASIQDYILKSWSLVKIGTTVSQKKLFFNLNKLKAKIMQNNQKYLTDDNVKYIAKTLDVDSSEVIMMDNRINHRDIYLNKKTNNDEDNNSEMIDLIKDKRGSVESIVANKNDKKLKNKLLKQALNTLNDRERDIIIKRQLNDGGQITLKELSDIYKISSERVRQLEEKAINKIKNFIKENYKNNE